MQKDLSNLVAQLTAEFLTEDQLLTALALAESGEAAFPDDLLARGRQIFLTVSTIVADRLCGDATVQILANDSGPRTSEVMTIVPLLVNLLPEKALRDTSMVLVALLIVRMGVGAFCHRYAGSSKSDRHDDA